MNYADKAFHKAKYYKYERKTNRGENKSKKSRANRDVREHYIINELGMKNLADAILKSAVEDAQKSAVEDAHDDSIMLKEDVRDFATGKDKGWCKTLCRISHVDYNAYKNRIEELL